MIEQSKEHLNISTEFWNEFIESLRYDNTMPFCKTEVVYDTLLSPKVLESLLATKGITADFVTKEFPVPVKDALESEKDKSGYFSIDYLMSSKDKKTVYLVELKTTEDSFDVQQLARYISLCDKEKFTNILSKYRGFKKEKYATNPAYDNQREDIENKLNIQKLENIELIYIKPEEKSLAIILDGKAENSKKHKGKSKKYSDLKSALDEIATHLISLNNLKKDVDKDTLLYQFLEIWEKTKAKN